MIPLKSMQRKKEILRKNPRRDNLKGESSAVRKDPKRPADTANRTPRRLSTNAASRSTKVEITPERSKKDVTVDVGKYSPLFSCTQEKEEVTWDWGNKGKKYYEAKAKVRAGLQETEVEELNNRKRVLPIVRAFPSKRKIISQSNSDFSRISEELLALTEKIKACKEEKSSSSENSSAGTCAANGNLPENCSSRTEQKHPSEHCSTAQDRAVVKSRSSVNPVSQDDSLLPNELPDSKRTSVNSDQYGFHDAQQMFADDNEDDLLNYLDEGDDELNDCFLKCTQEVEEKLFDPVSNTFKSPKLLKSINSGLCGSPEYNNNKCAVIASTPTSVRKKRSCLASRLFSSSKKNAEINSSEVIVGGSSTDSKQETSKSMFNVERIKKEHGSPTLFGVGVESIKKESDSPMMFVVGVEEIKKEDDSPTIFGVGLEKIKKECHNKLAVPCRSSVTEVDKVKRETNSANDTRKLAANVKRSSVSSKAEPVPDTSSVSDRQPTGKFGAFTAKKSVVVNSEKTLSMCANLNRSAAKSSASKNAKSPRMNTSIKGLLGDDSFDAVLQTFAEEDEELLSQAGVETSLKESKNTTLWRKHHSSDALLSPRSSRITSVATGAAFSKNQNALKTVGKDALRKANSNCTKETVLGGSQDHLVGKASAPPAEVPGESGTESLKCTPEEIEQKRLKAKKKLEEKKKGSLSNKFLVQNNGSRRLSSNFQSSKNLRLNSR